MGVERRDRAIESSRAGGAGRLSLRLLRFAARGPLQFDLLALFTTLRAAYLDQLAPALVDHRLGDIILGRHIHAREAAEPFLIFIDAPHLLARLQYFGNRAKIEVAATVLFGPQDTAVL